MQRASVRRVLASEGRVLEPVALRRFGSSKGLVARVRETVDRQRRVYRLSRARAKLQKRLPSYAEQRFAVEEGPDLFRSFFAAYATADASKLRVVCTEPFLERVTAGIGIEKRTYGGIRALSFTSLLEPPQVLGTTLGFDKPAAARGMRDEPAFAQVVLKLVTEQRHVFLPDPRSNAKRGKDGKRRGGGGGMGGGGGGVGVGGGVGGGGSVGGGVWWEPVVCEETGLQFFQERLSGAVTWDPPSALGSIPAAPPFHLQHTGLSRTILPRHEILGDIGEEGGEEGGEGGDGRGGGEVEGGEGGEKGVVVATEGSTDPRGQSYRVENVVCFERALKLPGAATAASSTVPDEPWRIAAFLDWC